jgi:hypothetical protein
MYITIAMHEEELTEDDMETERRLAEEESKDLAFDIDCALGRI